MSNNPTFQIRCDPLDPTYGGMFGGEADTARKYVAGISRYFVDGLEVTKTEYERLLLKYHGGGVKAPASQEQATPMPEPDFKALAFRVASMNCESIALLEDELQRDPDALDDTIELLRQVWNGRNVEIEALNAKIDDLERTVRLERG